MKSFKHYLLFTTLFMGNTFYSEAMELNNTCDKNTPYLRIETNLPTLRREEITIKEWQDFIKIYNAVKHLLGDEEQHTVSLLTYNRLSPDEIDNLVDEISLLIQKFAGRKNTQTTISQLEKLDAFRQRLKARKKFYVQLDKLLEKVNLYNTNENLAIPHSPMYMEDAIKQWNPGFVDMGCLDDLLGLYKQERQSPKTTFGLKDAYKFYVWADNFIYKLRLAKEKENLDQNDEDLIELYSHVDNYKTLMHDYKIKSANLDRLLATCKLRAPKNILKESIKAKQIYFDTEGEAHSPLELFSNTENPQCKDIMVLHDGAIITQKMNVYPLNLSKVDTKNAEGYKTLIYNINSQGELFIDTDRMEKSMGGHVSILKGIPLESAGEIFFDENGKIYELNNNSGHYIPTPIHLLKAFRLLIKNYGTKILSSQFKFRVYYENKPPELMSQDVFLEKFGGK